MPAQGHPLGTAAARQRRSTAARAARRAHPANDATATHGVRRAKALRTAIALPGAVSAAHSGKRDDHVHGDDLIVLHHSCQLQNSWTSLSDDRLAHAPLNRRWY